MMIPEEALSRRGEPVIVIDDSGNERIGTIEFGDVTCRSISVYCEREGHSTGRVIVRDMRNLRPDPAGVRPCYQRVTCSK
jgi:hypothetical protein